MTTLDAQVERAMSVQSFSFIFAVSTAACRLGCSLLPAVVVVVVVLAIVIATIVTFNYVETATATDEAEANFVLVC